MGFSRQEYWSGLPLPSPGDLPDLGIEPKSPALQAEALPNHFSHIHLFVTLWTVARQAPLSVGVSRQEYWSGLSFPSPGDLPDLGIEPASLASPALARGFITTHTT